MYIVGIWTVDKVNVLQVSHLLSGNREVVETFPLTKEGCIDAGKFMYKNKQTSWSNSSSIDFPYEYGFEEDIRELMLQGYESMIPPPTFYEQTVGKYEIRGNTFAALAINVEIASDVQYFKANEGENAFANAVRWAQG